MESSNNLQERVALNCEFSLAAKAAEDKTKTSL